MPTTKTINKTIPVSETVCLLWELLQEQKRVIGSWAETHKFEVDGMWYQMRIERVEEPSNG